MKSRTHNPVVKLLHWAMALLFLWQFAALTLTWVLGKGDLSNLIGSTHGPVGALLFVLAVLRLAISVITYQSRPESENLFVRLGHLSLYGFMILVPTLALLRQYGSGRSIDVLGLVIFPGFDGPKIDWMVQAGSWHGELGFVFLALIAGHVAIALRRCEKQGLDALHKVSFRDMD